MLVGGILINKKFFIAIVIVVLIVICGLYLYDSSRTLTLNDYFEVSGNYSSEWNDSLNEIIVEKVFPLKFNQVYENVTVQVDFYKGSQLLKSISVMNSTEDGKLVVCISAELNEEPDNIDFDIIDGDLIESDVQGIEYGENFHWFK